MLLANDGSTTVLLGEIAGGELALRIVEERPLEAGEYAAEVALLGNIRDLMVRRSKLVAGDLIMSENLVLYSRSARVWDPTSDIPLGLQLRQLKVHQHRMALNSGIDSRTGCTFKNYVIHINDDFPIYVHESFSSGLGVDLAVSSDCDRGG